MRKGRLLISGAMVLLALLSYYGYREVNPVTGEKQAVGLSQAQEIALGLQAAPQMAREMGGLDPDSDAKYDPRAMVEVMAILARAGGGSGAPQFLSSHPDPGNRQERIREAITKKFPGGVPSNLTMGRTISSPKEASAEGPR